MGIGLPGTVICDRSYSLALSDAFVSNSLSWYTLLEASLLGCNTSHRKGNLGDGRGWGIPRK